MFKELKEIMSKELKKSVKMMSHQKENINKEIEIIDYIQENYPSKMKMKLKHYKIKSKNKTKQFGVCQ